MLLMRTSYSQNSRRKSRTMTVLFENKVSKSCSASTATFVPTLQFRKWLTILTQNGTHEANAGRDARKICRVDRREGGDTDECVSSLTYCAPRIARVTNGGNTTGLNRYA